MHIDTLDSILSLDIVDIAKELLGDRITKQKYGPNYKGLCPFHFETNPSFYVKPKKNFFVCYGCGLSGGPFTLVSKMKGNDKDTLKYLLNKIGIEFNENKDYAFELEYLYDADNLSFNVV